MKTKIFMMGIVTFLTCCFISCNSNEPTYNGGGTNENSSVEILAFEFELYPPYGVWFKNLSRGFVRFKWDFGNGKTSDDPDDYDSCYRIYDKFGTYNVSLTGYRSDGSYKVISKSVTFKEPEIYVKGYSVENIPFENRYYRVMIHNGSDGYWLGNWTPQLVSSALPFKYNLNSMLHLTNLDENTYYYVEVYFSKNTSSDGTLCLKDKILGRKLREDYQESYVYSNAYGSMLLKLEFEYR